MKKPKWLGEWTDDIDFWPDGGGEEEPEEEFLTEEDFEI